MIKNPDGETFIRSRLVRRHFREKGDQREDIFAMTALMDTLKSLLALSFKDNLTIMVADVKEAHLNAVMKLGDGGHYVRAPQGRRKPGTCWRWKK